VSEVRYLILAEGKSADTHYGKTARGVMRYAPEKVLALVDSERAGETEEGFPVVGSVEEGLAFNPTTALVGVATQGGRLPPGYRDLIKACIANGLDVENGLHEFLTSDGEIVELAKTHNVELRDLRKPPPDLNVPTGENLEIPGSISLMVGSDCAIGKMTVALELDREAKRRGVKSEFVPTGQTGIAIAGWGISVDAVVADFIAGAAERLVVEASRRGGELILVEGQGSLLHPQYSGVTLGLFHGSAPHTLILCHKAGEKFVDNDERFPIPPLSELVDLHERMSLIARPAKVVGIALNTRDLTEDEAREAVRAAEAETGLPATDPVRFGAGPLVDALLNHRG
jgi:uncharacterized NAD-dependent epimerase/dehydratase family protein